jgi:hypothetical protein
MLLVFAVLKHVVSLQRLAKWAWREPGINRPPVAPERIVERLLLARRLARWHSDDCLQSSLLAYRMLSDAGAGPILYVGFRDDQQGTVGHAWVVVDGRVMIDTAPRATRYVPAMAFGRGGALITPPAR